MIYLLYGNKNFLIDNELITLSQPFDPMNISKFDFDNESPQNAMEDAKTISLFGDKKLIICTHANMFTGATSKDIDIIEEYLNHPNPDTTIIFTVNNEKIDERKKITKLIKKKGCVKAFNAKIDVHHLIKSELQDFKIDNQTLNLLINRVGENPLILKNELAKIKIYKDDNHLISSNDIMNLTTKNIDTDIFKLIDHIVRNQKDEALEIYYEMLKINEEPLKIIILLASQFRIMYQAKQLLKRGLSEKDIATILKIHPYRVKLAIQNSRYIDSKVLLQYLADLADLDIGIKTGIINKDTALELFILKK